MAKDDSRHLEAMRRIRAKFPKWGARAIAHAYIEKLPPEEVDVTADSMARRLANKLEAADGVHQRRASRQEVLRALEWSLAEAAEILMKAVTLLHAWNEEERAGRYATGRRKKPRKSPPKKAPGGGRPIGKNR